METCTLCGIPVENELRNDDGDVFCCQGCLEVYTTLGDIEKEQTPYKKDEETGEDRDGGLREAYLGVEGMHCSACEVYLEKKALDVEGVIDAEASYTTDIIRISYDPSEIIEDELPGRVGAPGYDLYLRDGNPEGSGGVARLIIGGFFGMMVMVWYVLFLYPSYLGLGFSLIDVSGSAGLYLLLNVCMMASVVVFYTGYPILRGAYVSLVARQPNMDLLIAIAVVSAYLYSVHALLIGGSEVYFDVSVAVVMVVSLGNYYEESVKDRLGGRLRELTQERVDTATVHCRDGYREVGIEEVDEGDEVLVKPGERVPVDGDVVEGVSRVDESLFTGDPVPVVKENGDSVYGGSVVIDGSIVIRVREGGESTLDRVTSMVWEVQSTRPTAQKFADKIAAVFVPLVLTLSLITFVYGILTTTPSTAFLTATTVLIVSCPCALGLATPLAVASGLRSAFNHGIVFTDSSVFEDANDLDVVAFDKTGTLSTGEIEVKGIRTVNEVSQEEIVEHAAAVERHSDHPIATAITSLDTSNKEAVEVVHHPRGVFGRVEGERTAVGDTKFFKDIDWDTPDPIKGVDGVFVGWCGEARGVITLTDTPRREWREVFDKLGDKLIVLLTGDSVAERFKTHPGVDEVFTGVRPEAKVEAVRRLRVDGNTALVGDGVNDAPALAEADVGIAVGESALAVDAADAVIMNEDLRNVETVFSIAGGTKRRVRQNLAWAFLYNLVAVPLAIVGALNPLFAAAAMSTSSLIVVLNSGRSLGVERVSDHAETERSDRAVKEDSERYPGFQQDMGGSSEEGTKHDEAEAHA